MYAHPKGIVDSVETNQQCVANKTTMSSLCYPYGPGITCVCDDGGRIYKCFPEIKSEHGSRGAGGVAGAQTQLTDSYKGPPDEHENLDRRYVYVLTNTGLDIVN